MKNRELKVRIWDAQYKRFAKGYENKNHYDELYSDPPGLIFGALAHLNEYGEYYTVQQFTGLKDKNGKDIYEGDIVFRESYQADYIVKFENFRYLIEDVVCHGTKDAYRTDMISELSADLMIIGNIFENKDLLL